MVKRSGKQGYRSFTVVDATNHGGCDTKSHGGRYISRSPFGAAKKAFNELCRVKKIRGVCTFIITIKETTSESNKKLFTYKMHRKKLKEPLIRMEGTPNEFVIEYVVDGKKAKVHHSCKNKKQKTSGRMSKKTRRSSVLSANNARRVLNRLKKNRN